MNSSKNKRNRSHKKRKIISPEQHKSNWKFNFFIWLIKCLIPFQKFSGDKIQKQLDQQNSGKQNQISNKVNKN